MIPILYENDETGFDNNGICRLSDCISCVVTEERNGVYECDFEYPADGAYYEEIMPGRIIACLHEESNNIQPFDIVSYERNLNGITSFHAVHVSYRLSQMVVRGNISAFQAVDTLYKAISFLNANSGSADGFGFHVTTDMDNEEAHPSAFDGTPTSVKELMGGIEGSILDTFGGEWMFNKWTVTLLEARGEEKDFVVRYGLNMTGYDEETDFADTYATVIPYWKKEENGTVTVVYADTVDTGLTDYGDRKSCVPLDLSDKFQSQPTVAQLQAKARKYIKANRVNEPTQTIKVDFVRLENESGIELMQCKLCDTVRVVLPMYDLEKSFKIVKTAYNVLRERYDSMELGSKSLSLKEVMGL
mgnify:CR=1 FL=1